MQDRVDQDRVNQDSRIGGVSPSGSDVAADDMRSGLTDQQPADAARRAQTAETRAAARGGAATGTAGRVDVREGGEAAGAEPAGAEAGGGEAVGGAIAEIERVRRELAERTADLQRVSAEYANYRRRVERERESAGAAAKAAVAGELLTVLDDLERAAAHGDLTGPFKLVADGLIDTLHRVGLTPFGTEGDPFDPSVHEAASHRTSPEVSGPTVTMVLRRGYRFGERVLRPATVEVTEPDSDPDTESGLAGRDPDAGVGGARGSDADRAGGEGAGARGPGPHGRGGQGSE